MSQATFQQNFFFFTKTVCIAQNRYIQKNGHIHKKDFEAWGCCVRYWGKGEWYTANFKGLQKDFLWIFLVTGCFQIYKSNLIILKEGSRERVNQVTFLLYYVSCAEFPPCLGPLLAFESSYLVKYYRLLIQLDKANLSPPPPPSTGETIH